MALTFPPLVDALPTIEADNAAFDQAYRQWRDGLLAEHAAELVSRFHVSTDPNNLMPGWRFDELLHERIVGRALRLGERRWFYSLRLRFLAVQLLTRQVDLERHARAILKEKHQ